MNAEPVDTEWLRREVVNVIRLREAIGYGEKVVSCMVDGRELLLRAPTLAAVAALLWRRLAPYRPDVIAGMTLSADTLIAAVLLVAAADGAAVNGAIVRKQRKRYGLQKLIEGPKIPAGARVVIVDDLLNYGKTATRCVSAFRGVGARIVAFGVLLDYGRPSTRRLMAGYGIGVEALFSMSDVGLAPRLPARSLQVSPRWAKPVTGGAGLAGTDGTLYACAGGWLTAYTAAGEPVWRCQLGDAEHRLHVAAANTVLVTRDDGDTSTVLSVDPRDGTTGWQRSLPGPAVAVGLDEARKLVIAGGPGGVVGLDSIDGTLAWHRDRPAEGLAVGSDQLCVRTGGNLWFATTADGELTSQRWVGDDHGRLVAAGPAGFVTPVHRHGLICVDHTGTGRWIATLPAGRVTAVAWTGRHWAVAASDGTLWLLDDERGAPVAHHRMDATADAVAALDDRTLAWRGGDHLWAAALEPPTRRIAPRRPAGAR